MGLDVYVGTLTRYFTGDWKTSVVASGLARGIPTKIARRMADGTVTLVDARDIPPPTEEQKARTRDDVERWRADVWQPVVRSASAAAPLEWDESGEQPYFTDKPDWYGLGALLLLAAYEEQKPLFGSRGWYPKTLDFENWQRDPVLDAAMGSRKSRYGQLFGTEAWLPGEADPPLVVNLPRRRKRIRVGSVARLLAQLEQLNARTYRGASHDLAQWRNDEHVGGDDSSHPFEPNAKFGLSIFMELTQKAVQHRLPMLLDY